MGEMKSRTERFSITWFHDDDVSFEICTWLLQGHFMLHR